MVRASEDVKYWPDGHRFPADDQESVAAVEACRKIWEGLVGGPSASRPPTQLVITYRCVFDDADLVGVDQEAEQKLDLGDCAIDFAGEAWHSEPFGSRFAMPPIGVAYWSIAANQFGWRRLQPLVSMTVNRHPLNAAGGVIIAAPDFAWAWHPYDGGSLLLRSQ